MNTIFRPDLLVGKRIVVAGGTSGLGRAVAHACADAGAAICVIGRSHENLEAVLETLTPPAGIEHHQYVVGDLSKFDTAVSAFNAVRTQMQGVDGVFYSAGAEVIKPTRSLNAQDVDTTMGAALYGALGAAKVCASKRFWRQTGKDTSGNSLVYMSSVSGRSGKTGMAAYGAARAGISGLTRNLAVELAPMNVRVNTIVSGAVSTEMHGRITENLSPISLQAYEDAHPLGFGHPHDIASLSLFLMSDAASWITGTDLVIDGGYIA